MDKIVILNGKKWAYDWRTKKYTLIGDVEEEKEIKPTIQPTPIERKKSFKKIKQNKNESDVE